MTDRVAPRLVTISGLALTGTTSVAKLLASALNWDAVLVGDRFREYAQTHRIPLNAIPLDAHRAFDDLVQSELSNRRCAVFDGRYLGFFAKHHNDILRVCLTCDLPTRIARARTRANFLRDEEQERKLLEARDTSEREAFCALYGDDDFLSPKWFNLSLSNDNTASLNALVENILMHCRSSI